MANPLFENDEKLCFGFSGASYPPRRCVNHCLVINEDNAMRQLRISHNEADRKCSVSDSGNMFFIRSLDCLLLCQNIGIPWWSTITWVDNVRRIGRENAHRNVGWNWMHHRDRVRNRPQTVVLVASATLLNIPHSADGTPPMYWISLTVLMKNGNMNNNDIPTVLNGITSQYWMNTLHRTEIYFF